MKRNKWTLQIFLEFVFGLWSFYKNLDSSFIRNRRNPRTIGRDPVYEVTHGVLSSIFKSKVYFGNWMNFSVGIN